MLNPRKGRWMGLFGWRGVLGLVLASLCSASAHAAVIAVDTADYSGSRSQAAGEIITYGPWAGDPVKFSWNITFDANTKLFTYVYTISGWEGKGSGLSHLDITTSDGREGTEAFTKDNVFGTSGGVIDEIGDLNSSKFGAPTQAYGIRVDPKGDGSPQVFTLVTDRAPIWGSFAAKAGLGTQSGGYSVGWKTWKDYLADTSIANFVFNKNQWIAVPDTRTHSQVIPEPSSIVLAGIGLALGGIAWRRKGRR